MTASTASNAQNVPKAVFVRYQTQAAKSGLALPHLLWDWAHPATSAPGPRLTCHAYPSFLCLLAYATNARHRPFACARSALNCSCKSSRPLFGVYLFACSLPSLGRIRYFVPCQCRGGRLGRTRPKGMGLLLEALRRESLRSSMLRRVCRYWGLSVADERAVNASSNRTAPPLPLVCAVPHRHRNCAHPNHICPGTGAPLPHLNRDCAHPCHTHLRGDLMYLQRGWAHPAHIVTGTGAHCPLPCHICAGTRQLFVPGEIGGNSFMAQDPPIFLPCDDCLGEFLCETGASLTPTNPGKRSRTHAQTESLSGRHRFL
jgi:hypothetical protein